MKKLPEIVHGVGRIFALFSGILCAFALSSKAQSLPDSSGNDHTYRVMFYNVENLFDTFDDPATNDDEFTPDGNKRWTYFRYREKLNHIAKTIIAVGAWEPPAVVGMCEVENFQVLQDLTKETMLKKFDYQMVHENSPDLRGIDNAIIYRKDKLVEISHRAISVSVDQHRPTRDILYVSFLIARQDTLHLFVNHWPSRFGGKEFTEEKRQLAATVLRQQVDSLFAISNLSKILIMGDFNDEPLDNSLTTSLGAITDNSDPAPGKLYNLSVPDLRTGIGTLVYKEIDISWFLFDQMIVSGGLMVGDRLICSESKNNIYTAAWLLKKNRPFRTYQGPIYQGGFSDHLPIFIDLHHHGK
ncbi:MAG: endonuclease [Cyclobacteriaceae bacterium]|nr:endonuclease [Cyclobacteriaceae bacterium]